jgi:hypothetical protein
MEGDNFCDVQDNLSLKPLMLIILASTILQFSMVSRPSMRGVLGVTEQGILFSRGEIKVGRGANGPVGAMAVRTMR